MPSPVGFTKTFEDDEDDLGAATSPSSSEDDKTLMASVSTSPSSSSSVTPRMGHGVVVARAAGHRTALAALHATSPLRLLAQGAPHGHGSARSATVCMVTFGGGLVDGDAVRLDVTVEENATLVLCTQSSTKVYRGRSTQSVRARVRGTFVWLPDPVACFRGSRFEQTLDVALEGAGSCVLLDGFTSGRAAYGERWDFDAFATRTRVSRDGRPCVHDALRLDASDGSIGERMDRFDAFATLVAVGPRVAPLFGPMLERGRSNVSDVVVAPSPLPVDPEALAGAPATPDPSGALVRIAAVRPSDALDEVRRRLRNLPDIDVVDPFASRR